MSEKFIKHNECRYTHPTRLVASRLANIFGNGTMYRHDKNLKRAIDPEITKLNIPSSAEVASELRSAEGTRKNRKKSCEGLAKV